MNTLATGCDQKGGMSGEQNTKTQILQNRWNPATCFDQRLFIKFHVCCVLTIYAYTITRVHCNVLKFCLLLLHYAQVYSIIIHDGCVLIVCVNVQMCFRVQGIYPKLQFMADCESL